MRSCNVIQIKTWVNPTQLVRLGYLLNEFEQENNAGAPVVDYTSAAPEVNAVDERVAAAEPIEAVVVEKAMIETPAPAAPVEKVRQRRAKKEAPAVVGEIKPAETNLVNPLADPTIVVANDAPAVNVVDLVKEHAKQCGMVAAIAAINSTGAAKVTAIDSAKLPAFVERLQAELAAKASKA